MQNDKKYNFQNPEIQSKAVQLARSAERPTSYNTPKKMALELKREIMKEQILKDGFLEQIQPALQEITQVMIENAKTPEGVADRRILLRASGIFHQKTVAELEWQAGAQERAHSQYLIDQLNGVSRRTA
jgi:hypothetical protein